MNPSETIWMLTYFRQVYGGRVETAAAGEAYVVALTGEALCVKDLHLAWSRDGLRWTALNGNRPTLPPPTWARHTRDPFVRRGPDGFFHLLATGGRAPTDILYGRSPNFIARTARTAICKWRQPTYWMARTTLRRTRSRPLSWKVRPCCRCPRQPVPAALRLVPGE